MKAAILTIGLASIAARRADAQPAPPAPAPRPAATNADRAATLYDDGKARFDIGDYAGAIAAWKQSYLLSRAPLLLFNIGQAYRLAGDCAMANRLYMNYERVEPAPPNRAELEIAKAKCAGVPTSGGDAESTPGDASSEVGGDTAEAAHGPSTRAPAPPIAAATSPRSSVNSAPAPDDRTPARLQLAGIAVAGAGGIAGIAAIAYALAARSNYGTITDAPPGTIWNSAYANAQAAGNDDRTRAILLGAVGVAAIATGGALWWLGHERGRSSVDVAITSNLTEMTWTCAF